MSKTIKTLEYEECERILQLYKPIEGTYPLRGKESIRYLLILLFLDAGLRLQEALQLRKIDLLYNGLAVNAVTVRAEIAKNHRSRMIPASIRLMEAILLAEEHFWQPAHIQQNDFAFCKEPGGKPITSRSVQLWIETMGQIVFHKKITPHIFRHTFATRLMRKCSIRVVQQLLGHKSIVSTQVYTHPNSNDLKEAINSI